jgi:hypothetical protein
MFKEINLSNEFNYLLKIIKKVTNFWHTKVQQHKSEVEIIFSQQWLLKATKCDKKLLVALINKIHTCQEKL